MCVCVYTRAYVHTYPNLKILIIKKCQDIFSQQLKPNLHSYKRRWECPPFSALQAPTVFFMLLATFFRVADVTFKTQSEIFCFSSSSDFGKHF